MAEGQTTAPGSVDRAVAGRLTRTGVMLVGFVVLIAAALAVSGWENAVEAVAALGPAKLAVLALLSLVHYALRGLRWHLMVRQSCPETMLSQNLRHYFGGFAMTATPGRLGELVRLRWLSRETGRRFSRLLPAAFADRAVELAAMLLVIVAALLSAGLGSAAAWWVVVAAAGIVWLACRPKALERAVIGGWRLAGRRATRLFVRLRRMTRDLGPFLRRRLFLPALALGAVGWALEGGAFFLLLTWMGADIGLAAATAIFLVSVLSGTLAGLPGGLGGTEATAVALLLVQGVPADTAILATAIIRVATLWFAVTIGFVVFPVAEMRAAGSAVQQAGGPARKDAREG